MEALSATRRILSELPDPLALLEGIFTASPVPLQLYSVEGQSLLTNRAFVELFGVAPPPEYNVLQDEVARQQGVLELIRRAFAGEEMTMPPVWYDPGALTQVTVSGGKRVAMSATFVPLFGSQGRVTHVVVSFRDVTAQLRAQDAIRYTRRLSGILGELGEQLSTAVAPKVNLHRLISLCVPEFADWATAGLLDPTGCGLRAAVVHRDPALASECERYLSRHVQSVIPARSEVAPLLEGHPVLLSRVTPPMMERFAQDAEHLRALQVLGVASVILVPMAVKGRILGALSFMRGEGSQPYEEVDLDFAEDLANRAALWLECARGLQEERAARATLERAAGAREELLTAVSEQLGPPLRALAERLEALEPDDVARVELARIHRVAGELRDLSALSVPRPPLARAEVDWVPLVRRCAERWRARAKLAVELPTAAVGLWDPARLEQLVEQLLENAALRGAGKPVAVRLRQSPEQVTLEVRDQGPGLSADAQARLFEGFQRELPAGDGRGPGLGLWISRRLAEAMGGTLTVDSPAAGGATFTVALPRTGEPPPPARAPP